MLGRIKHYIIDYYRGTSVVQDYHNIIDEVNRGIDYLREVQKRKLSHLLLYAKQNVDFYRNCLAKIDENTIKFFPYEVLKTLPIISKDDLLKAPSLFSSAKPPKHIINYTGGSTGEPLIYRVDLACVSRTRAFNLYWWTQAFNYKFGDRILVIGGSSIGSNKSFQLRVYNYLQSKIFLEGGNVSPELLRKNVELLCKGEFDVIYAYPSSLLIHIETALKLGMNFKRRIKGIASTSETLFPSVRTSIENFFKAPVYDVYGARDGGIVADECVYRNGLHYNFQDCYVEEYNESSEQITSELVLTNLVSYSQPMIRYRVGDLGKLIDAPCECENPLPRIIDFSGRTRDILSLPNGKVIHGSLFNKVISHFSKVKQYQVLYRHGTLRFIFLVSTSFTDQEESNFKSQITELTGLNSIIVDYSGNFKYTQSGKLKTVIVE